MTATKNKCWIWRWFKKKKIIHNSSYSIVPFTFQFLFCSKFSFFFIFLSFASWTFTFHSVHSPNPHLIELQQLSCQHGFFCKQKSSGIWNYCFSILTLKMEENKQYSGFFILRKRKMWLRKKDLFRLWRKYCEWSNVCKIFEDCFVKQYSTVG